MSQTERMLLEKKGKELVFQFGPVPTEPGRIFGGRSGKTEKFIHGQTPYGGVFAVPLQGDYSVYIRVTSYILTTLPAVKSVSTVSYILVTLPTLNLSFVP